jgi:FdhD protein
MTASIVDTLRVLRINGDASHYIEDSIVKESPLTIIFNGEELVTLLCSPQHLNYLAIGYLVSEGLLKQKGDIKRLLTDDRRGVVRVDTAGGSQGETAELTFKRLITSGCGRGSSVYSMGEVPISRITSSVSIAPSQVLTLMKNFQQRCTTFKITGGVHAAALCDKNEILAFHEDIGRHNAIDKVLGQCFLEDITTAEPLLLTSGRVSSEVVLKTTRRGISILISKSAPTDLAVKLAQDLGITLVGFVRGQRMNVYANEWRVNTNERPGD